MNRYRSIDALQKALSEEVFSYASDSKKAAGRALGTFVEIITFYLLDSWGLKKNIAIERPLSEYANRQISHNVEFTLHPYSLVKNMKMPLSSIPITSRKIIKEVAISPEKIKGLNLLDKSELLKNSCTIASNGNSFYNAIINSILARDNSCDIDVVMMNSIPFAMFECKRVGVEEGQKKGPQTIEKAKQGAYVARTVSSLQRIRRKNGKLTGFIENSTGDFLEDDYYTLLEKIISGSEKSLLQNFVLTVGIVSNHGNWFTAENKNKELEVLAQSYDWLIFLSDEGLAAFIEKIVFSDELPSAKRAFQESYGDKKKKNRFTKSIIDKKAHFELEKYFSRNKDEINNWFNLISPPSKAIGDLKEQIESLCSMDWGEIYK